MDRHLAQIEKYMEELAAEYNAAMKKECCDDPDCPHCRPRCPTCGRLMGRAKKNKGRIKKARSPPGQRKSDKWILSQLRPASKGKGH